MTAIQPKLENFQSFIVLNVHTFCDPAASSLIPDMKDKQNNTKMLSACKRSEKQSIFKFASSQALTVMITLICYVNFNSVIKMQYLVKVLSHF